MDDDRERSASETGPGHRSTARASSSAIAIARPPHPTPSQQFKRGEQAQQKQNQQKQNQQKQNQPSASAPASPPAAPAPASRTRSSTTRAPGTTPALLRRLSRPRPSATHRSRDSSQRPGTSANTAAPSAAPGDSSARRSRLASAAARPPGPPLSSNSPAAANAQRRLPPASKAPQRRRTKSPPPCTPTPSAPAPPSACPSLDSGATAVTVTSANHADVLPPSPTAPAPAPTAVVVSAVASPQSALSPDTTPSSVASDAPARQNRLPARFSSNGIATADGPPPSLAYRRRSLSMDNRYSSPLPGLGDRTTSSSTFSTRQFSRTGSLKSREESRKRNSLRLEREREEYGNGYIDYGDHDRTIRAYEGLPARSPRHSLRNAPRHSESPEEEEDVFLKLARTSTTSDSAASKMEIKSRRRSRLSQFPQHRQSLPVEAIRRPSVESLSSSRRDAMEVDSQSTPPSVADDDEDTWRASTYIQSSPLTDYRARRRSTTQDEPLAQPQERISVTPRASLGGRHLSLLRQEHSPRSPQSNHSRSYSVESSPGRTGLTTKSLARVPHASPAGELPMAPPMTANRSVGGGSSAGNDDTASTVSTTAASSVWDELDDLKSRIRRLELTGKMPAMGGGGGSGGSGGNTSNSSGERPQTATTTVTTISSSPRHKEPYQNGVSPPNSTFSTGSASNHPLLHTAIANAKSRVAPEVYRHLQLAANDALVLANAVNPNETPSSPTSNRQLQKNANSVIRSLTELAIALTERPERRSTIATPNHIPPSEQGSRSESRIGPLSASRAVTMFSSGGREGSGRESMFGDRSLLQQRAHNRLAERKGSTATLSGGAAAGYSPRSHADAGSSPSTAALRQRTSMLMKSRAPTVLDGGDDDDDDERLRAPSRATTELPGLAGIGGHRSVRDFSSIERPTPGSASRRNLHQFTPTSVSFPSPTLPSAASRRFFTMRQDNSDAVSEVGSHTSRFERDRDSSSVAASVNGSRHAADTDFGTNRYRSGSLAQRRTTLRPSVDLSHGRGDMARSSLLR